MLYTVTIGLLEGEQGILKFDRPVSEQTKALLWDQRLKASLEVKDDETLAAVMSRARQIFELKPRMTSGIGVEKEMSPDQVARLPYFYAFYEVDNDPPVQQRGSSMFAFNLVTVDPQGRAHWNRESDEIPYGDLVRSRAEGLLDGDPLMPYFVLAWPQGSGPFREAWTLLQTIWTITGGIMGTVAAVRLTADQSRRFMTRLRTAGIVEDRSRDWVRRGGGPAEIRRTVERQAWAPADMRALLDLETDEDAVAVLELFGSAREADGKYEMSESAEAVLLRIIEQEAIELSNLGYRDLSAEDRSIVEVRLRIILQTGKAPEEFPPLPSEARGAVPPDDGIG